MMRRVIPNLLDGIGRGRLLTSWATAGLSPLIDPTPRCSSGAQSSGSGSSRHWRALPGAARQQTFGIGFCSDLRVVHAELAEAEYHKEADKLLDLLHDKLEAYVEDLDIQDGDVEYSQGVLTVSLGKMGTYVLNKQTPNRQIWMSSPVSGPFRYDCHSGHWVYARNNQDLVQQLEQELKLLTGVDIKL